MPSNLPRAFIEASLTFSGLPSLFQALHALGRHEESLREMTELQQTFQNDPQARARASKPRAP